MIEDWVVTYRVECSDSMTIFEGFRGSEQECKRIAIHSAPPNIFEGAKVTSFKTIVGPAAAWDQFLEENA